MFCRKVSLLFAVIVILAAISHTVEADLTEEEVIAKEREWTVKTVQHYLQGFREALPYKLYNWSDEELDSIDDLFALPDTQSNKSGPDDLKDADDHERTGVVRNLRGMKQSISR